MSTTLWHDDSSGYSQAAVAAPMWLLADRPPSDTPLDDSVLLAPVDALDDVVAAAIVADDLAHRVKLNRLPVVAGLLTLRHADRLDVGPRAYWIAVGSAAEMTSYSPDRHNQDVYCFLTKARLREGEEIAVCPGSPGRTCGTIYKRSAWEAMLTQPGFRCANCSFDPQQPAWRPPSLRRTRPLESILELLGRGGA